MTASTFGSNGSSSTEPGDGKRDPAVPSLDARVGLLLLSCFAGVLVGGAVYYATDRSWIPALAAGIAYSAIHPWLGHKAIGLAERIAKGAQASDGWSGNTRANAAGVWPVILLVWLVAALPFFIINKLFVPPKAKKKDSGVA